MLLTIIMHVVRYSSNILGICIAQFIKVQQCTNLGDALVIKQQHHAILYSVSPLSHTKLFSMDARVLGQTS